MAFEFYINSYKFSEPPRFSITSRAISTGHDEVTWEEDWRFEGMISCDGIADAKSKWDAIRNELHKDNLKSFQFKDTETGQTVLKRSADDETCYIYPELTDLSFPSDGADAAWATNLKYSFSLKVILKPSGSSTEKNRVYQDVTLRIGVNELGLSTVTESGEVRYSESTYENPRALFSLSKRKFRATSQSFDWNSDRTRCRYSITWNELPFDPQIDNFVLSPNFNVTMRQDYFAKHFNLTFSVKIPKRRQSPPSPPDLRRVGGGEIKVGAISSISKWVPEIFSEGLPSEVREVLGILVRRFVPAHSSFNRQVSYNWNAAQRTLQVNLSYSVPRFGTIISFSYSISLTHPSRQRTDIARFQQFPLVYESGYTAGSLSERLQVQSLDATRWYLAPLDDSELLVSSESESMSPSRFSQQPIGGRLGNEVQHTYSLNRTYKVYRLMETGIDFSKIVNRFYGTIKSKMGYRLPSGSGSIRRGRL